MWRFTLWGRYRRRGGDDGSRDRRRIVDPAALIAHALSSLEPGGSAELDACVPYLRDVKMQRVCQARVAVRVRETIADERRELLCNPLAHPGAPFRSDVGRVVEWRDGVNSYDYGLIRNDVVGAGVAGR
ncbi:MAG: hypothetical protein ACREJG_06980 [Candidatus Rokuibacteriota bacterium]